MKSLKPHHHSAIISFILFLAAYVFRHQIGYTISFIIISYSLGFLIVFLLGPGFEKLLKSRLVLRPLILFLTYLAISQFALWIDTKSRLHLLCSIQFVFSILCFILYDIFGIRNQSACADEKDSSSETPS